jgi:HAD superfamily hydrolase (TIGR01509 family)
MREPALIFDFGNVVAFFDYLKVCERLGAKLGLTAEAFRLRIVERGFAPLLGHFESGKIGPEEFAEEVMVRTGLTVTYDEFVDAWQDIFRINEPVARLIERLKSDGYTLLLGSNTNILHSTYYRRQFASMMALFDHLVLSHEVGHIKPSPEFYRACVAASGLPAAACVFVDDLAENVDGARKASMIGLHYIDTPALIADLTRLGVAAGT